MVENDELDREEESDYEWVDKYGDYSQVPVPPGERRSLLNMFLVYTGVLATFAVLMIAGAVAPRFNLRDFIIIAFVGSAILGIIGAFTAYIGAVSKGSTYLNMRFPFGKIGSQFFGAISSGIASGIGWFGFQSWFFGIIMNTLFPGYWWTQPGVAAIWGGSLMLLTAYFGYKGLSYLSYIVVPFFIILAGVGFMFGFEEMGLSELMAMEPEEAAPISVGITEVIGMYVSGAIITSDIARYATKRWHGSMAWFVQLIVVQPFLLIGAGILTMATGEPNFAAAFAAAGAGLAAFLVIVLAQWSTNDNNLYSGSLAFNTFIPTKKKYIVLGTGAIGIVLAAIVGFSAGISMNPMVQFLGLLGRILPPIGGALIADFYIYRAVKGINIDERYNFEVGMEVPRINWVGWLAVGGGVATAFLLDWGITAINGLIVALIIYSVLAPLMDRAGVSLHLGKTELGKDGM